MKGDYLDAESVTKEIAIRNQIVQKVRDSLINEEIIRKCNSSQSLSDDDLVKDEEQQRLVLIDQEDFERVRTNLIEEIDRMRTRLKSLRYLRRQNSEEEKHQDRMEQSMICQRQMRAVEELREKRSL